MDKEYLFNLVKSVSCEPEMGLTSEINDLLEREVNVEFHKLAIEDDYFKLTIKLKKYSLVEAKKVFSSLVRFIEYTSTFYVREDTEKGIEYFLLSSNSSKKGFLCRIIFM
jgi:hypothetical protein